MPDQPEARPSTRVDQVGHSGVYPISGPWPAGQAAVVGQGELGHPEQRRRLRRMPFPNLDTVSLGFGRALFGGYFLYNGVNHFVNWRPLSAYARSKHVPAASAVVFGSGALLMLGGLSLLTGVRPKTGASLVTTFLAGTSPVMHNFWALEGEQRMSETVNFTKNMALIGGACLAAAVPEPWPGARGAERWLAAVGRLWQRAAPRRTTRALMTVPHPPPAGV